jgi:hypothetical protein
MEHPIDLGKFNQTKIKIKPAKDLIFVKHLRKSDARNWHNRFDT